MAGFNMPPDWSQSGRLPGEGPEELFEVVFTLPGHVEIYGPFSETEAEEEAAIARRESPKASVRIRPAMVEA